MVFLQRDRFPERRFPIAVDAELLQKPLYRLFYVVMTTLFPRDVLLQYIVSDEAFNSSHSLTCYVKSLRNQV